MRRHHEVAVARVNEEIVYERVRRQARAERRPRLPAVDQLKYLMSIPFDLAAPGLRLDSTWDSLRDHPRFQKLVSR